MSRQIITLTTDWNSKSYYEGAVKGALLSECGDVNIVNISHEITPFNITQAAFVLKNSYKFFPPKTVHIIAINSNYSNTQTYNLLSFDNHYFLCTDNGFFSLFLDEEPQFSIEIETKNQSEAIFPELSVYPKIINKIIQNIPFEEIGKPTTHKVELPKLLPTYDNDSITAHVINIDSYNNIICNVTREKFEEIRKGRKFEIIVQNNNYIIDKITSKYTETSNGDILAIFNSVGLLEIAQKNGKISEMLGIVVKSNIKIKFYE
jgi:S-adenosylmethionine hydrolase